MKKNIIERAETISENTIEAMLRLICVINGVDYERYYNSITMFNEFGLGPSDPNFIELSPLDWDNPKSLNQDSIVFRTKFLTLLFTSILGNSHKLIKNTKNNYKIDNDKAKARLSNDLNFEFYKACHKVAYDSYARNNWTDGMLDLNKILVSSVLKNDTDIVVASISAIVNRILSGIKYNPVEGRLLDNVSVIYQLFRLSYVLITYDSSYSKMISSDKFLDLNIDGDLSQIMFKYGKKLSKYITNNKKYVNPMFVAYMKANPALYSNMKSAKVPEIAMSLYALNFLSFIIDNENIEKFLTHIINTKIKFAGKLPKEKGRDIKGLLNMLFPNR